MRPAPGERPTLVAALVVENHVTVRAGTGPHTIFQPEAMRDTHIELANEGREPVSVWIASRGRAAMTLRLGPGEHSFEEIARVSRISFECMSTAATTCTLRYRITYAPPLRGSREPVAISHWVVPQTCHGRSLGPPGTACVPGMGGDVCVEEIQGQTVILPDTGIVHSPMRVEVQRCENDACGNEATDRRCDVKLLVLRDPGLDDLVFDVGCDQPTFNQVVQGAREIRLDLDCLGFNGCGFTPTMQEAFVRWQICHVPGQWLSLFP